MSIISSILAITFGTVFPILASIALIRLLINKKPDIGALVRPEFRDPYFAEVKGNIYDLEKEIEKIKKTKAKRASDYKEYKEGGERELPTRA